MLYGASYYLEYQPYERLEDDIRLMQDLDLSVVRIADSIWSKSEPADGRFEFDWLDRVIDALHQANIKVILITPTYAIPPWLHRKHPEIMAKHARNVNEYYGARQNMNFAHPTYLYYAERIIRRYVSRYAPHPAVIGYQLDNETSSGPLFNHDVIVKFTEYLKAKFGSVERLNEIWGLTYWSHRLSDWAELWTPDGDTTPGYNLEWRRFQSSLVTEFLTWQVRIVKEYARSDQFVTQDFVLAYNRPESDIYQISKAMDIVSINPYHVTQDGLDLERDQKTRVGSAEWVEQQGVFSIYLNGDWARGAKQSNFLVTEVNAHSIGGSHTNYPGYPGQLRQVAYALISRGANMIAYWHWHTLHYGAETYWGGILGHDLEAGRIALEFKQIAEEMQEHDALLTDLKPDCDVAFLYSEDSKYALEYMPCLSLPDSNYPDPRTYQRIFNTFYCAFFQIRAQMVIIHPGQSFEDYPLLVVPALYIADDTVLDKLLQYAANGGHLLLTFRTGYADEFARARWERAPGRLRDAVGASYQEYSNLFKPIAVSATDAFDLPVDAAAEGWADGLLLEGADPLAYYEHPHFGSFPAVVTKVFGSGRVTYCGTLPNRPFASALARWVLAQAGQQPLMPELPDTVRATTARTTDDKRLWFFTNWSWMPRTLSLHFRGRSIFDERILESGDLLSLGAWDVKIVVQE